ncbi:unnamed protein product [Commensalibacter communis]|uniref:phage neck terminator protein n=1 Tax=Commensalibacter communis TaxID=2972786 RepID=UPI0022FF5688|nr:hypothetical protein [Commensalibacter communis]CAI3961087.1 unnamed protein product [Commensalibacter communis]CAI3961875.1 unnamed protein product [Commensalibacter communis]
MTDDNKTNDKLPAKVTAKAPKDGEFPVLKTLTYKEMYNLVGKFLQKAIPIKGAKLKIIKGLSNRTSMPKAPYVLMNIVDENRLSSSETRYTDKHKILWSRSQVTITMMFVGNDNIPALQMAKAFTVRFDDAWASEQFEQYGEPFYPLYSDEVKIESSFTNSEDQYEDVCSVDVYFEYHPEFGICENSAKEVIMNVNIADKS